MSTHWIACKFDEQSEDSIATTPIGAALSEALFLASECELNVSDFCDDGHEFTDHELREILVTEDNRDNWEHIDGAEWFEVGKSHFYEMTGKTVAVRVFLACEIKL